MKTLLNPSFVSVIFAQVASLFGDAVLRFALPLYVLNLTGSAALMGAVAAAAWIPYIVLTPIGGVAADRVNKRRIMAVLDALLAVTCAAYLALDGIIDLIGLSICALIILYAAQSVYQPTVQAAVPFIVPRDSIVRATAIVSQISALSGLVGPVLGGLLFGLFGIEPVVLVSGVAFAASAVLIVVFVRIPRDAIERSNVGVVRTVVNDIAESFAFLRHDRPVILKLIFLVAGINVSLTAFILIGAPVIVTQILGLPNQYMGFAEGAMGAGRPGGRHLGGRVRPSPQARSCAAVSAGGGCGAAAYRRHLGRVDGRLCGVRHPFGQPVRGHGVRNDVQHPVYLVRAAGNAGPPRGQGDRAHHVAGELRAAVGQLIYGGLFDALRGNLVPVALGTALIAFVIGAITFRVLKRGLAELPADAAGSVGGDGENASEDVTEERLPVNA